MEHRTHIEEVEEQAALFALGALPETEAETFRQRLSTGCPFCMSEVDQCSAALSALELTVPQLTPPPRLRERLLESIGQQDERPAPVEEMTLVRSDEERWKPSPFPGVEMRFLYERKTMLVRMAADSRIPAHSHPTAEQCLMLEGSITSNGVTANAGDFVYMPAGSMHDDLYSRDGALFLIAYA